MRILEAILTVHSLTFETVDDRIGHLALRTLGCRSCAACAHKLVHAGLICWWFALHLHRSHNCTAANRTEVLQWSQSARHAHGVVPSWGQQGCVVLGVELLVADNTAQLARKIGRIRVSLGAFREWFLPHST